MNIYPTHSCFDDALDNLIFLMKRDGRDQVEDGRLLIVHAIIAPDGVPLAHAWIERDGKDVIFSGILEGERVMISVDREEYYRESKVSDVTRYTLWQAATAEAKAGHYGPWEPRYIALCNRTPGEQIREQMEEKCSPKGNVGHDMDQLDPH